MSRNILNSPTISKIIFSYIDKKGNKHKELVKVHYVDNKNCFFVGTVPSNFVKPGWRAKAEIIVYTQIGTYTTRAIIKDTSFTLSDVYYTIDLPKNWEYKEFRSDKRYRTSLPVIIKFSDDTEIIMETYDLSPGGFSFLGDYTFTTLQSRFPCSCTIVFPEESNVDFEDSKYKASAKFVRQQSLQDELGISIGKIHCFNFLDVSIDDAQKITNYLEQSK